MTPRVLVPESGPLRIHLLGAPCSGKSTLARHLTAEWQQAGYKVAFLPEPARTLIPLLPVSRRLTPAEQAALAHLQEETEREALCTHDIVISDTGLWLNLYYARLTSRGQGDDAFWLEGIATLARRSTARLFYCRREWECPEGMADPVRREGSDREMAEIDRGLQAMIRAEGIAVIPLAGSMGERAEGVRGAVGLALPEGAESRVGHPNG